MDGLCSLALGRRDGEVAIGRGATSHGNDEGCAVIDASSVSERDALVERQDENKSSE